MKISRIEEHGDERANREPGVGVGVAAQNVVIDLKAILGHPTIRFRIWMYGCVLDPFLILVLDAGILNCAAPQVMKSQMSNRTRVRAIGPATLSNLGPGFDALGLCIDSHFDVVEAINVSTPGVVVDEVIGTNDPIPLDPSSNTAAIAAAAVLAGSGENGGLRLRIEKGIPLGSGIGGSAASAAEGSPR